MKAYTYKAMLLLLIALLALVACTSEPAAEEGAEEEIAQEEAVEDEGETESFEEVPATEPAAEEVVPAEEAVAEEEDMSSQWEGQTISVLQSTGGGGRGVQPGIEEWASRTGANVEITQLPYAEEREKALLDFVSNTGTYDVIQIDGAIWASEMAPYLEPLDSWIEEEPLPESDDFIPAVLRAMRVPYPSGATYAVPVRYGTLIYHYRKDLFDEAGLEAPTYWDEYLNAAQTLTTDEIYGTTHAGKQGNFLVYNWFGFLYGFGADFVNEDQTACAMDERAVEATEFWADLYLEHEVVPPGMIAYEHDDVITAIQQQVAASALTYSPYALEFENPEKSQVVGQMAWAPVPIKRDVPGLENGGVGTGWGLAINADSDVKEMAWDMIRFVTGPEMQLHLALNAANAPVRRSVFLNPEYQEAFPAADATLAALEGDRIRPGLVNWTSVEEMMASELSAALIGDKTAEEAITDACALLDELLAENQ